MEITMTIRRIGMKSIWRRAFVVSLFLFVTISCAIGQLEDAPSWYEAVVTAVVDGDTIQIQFVDDPPPDCSWNERVRFIGVDTPELYTVPAEYYAREARTYTNRYYQKNVLIEFDSVSSTRDQYGRLLAYVYNDINQIPLTNNSFPKDMDSSMVSLHLILNECMIQECRTRCPCKSKRLWGLGGE